MTDDPRLIRWTPQQHYDTAVHALAEIAGLKYSDNAALAAQLSIAHSLLGIMRQLEIIAAQQTSPLQR